MNESVGARIRQLRLHKFATQNEIAKLLSITVPGYYKLEVGTTDINLSRLIRLAEIFGVRPGVLSADDVELSDLKVEVEGLKERLSKSHWYTIEL